MRTDERPNPEERLPPSSSFIPPRYTAGRRPAYGEDLQRFQIGIQRGLIGYRTGNEAEKSYNNQSGSPYYVPPFTLCYRL